MNSEAFAGLSTAAKKASILNNTQRKEEKAQMRDRRSVCMLRKASLQSKS
jgi:hypothetical protein